ncbi:MAG: hypothetical protein JSS20_19545 [Proteobacteria bacterium]|nr:hypothetical protein [Pseudomonadota bacterium]
MTRSTVLGVVMRKSTRCAGVIASIAFACPALAGSSTSKTTVNAATITADKTAQKNDTTKLATDTAAYATLKKTFDANAAKVTSDKATIATNSAQISGLERQLSAALKTHDFTTALKLQQQLATLRTATAKVQAEVNMLNATLKTQQANLNGINEKIILDNRQLKLDTDKLNADQYYLAISGL